MNDKTPVDCPADDQWNCKYCAQAKSCELHSQHQHNHTPAPNSYTARKIGASPLLAAPYGVPATKKAKKLVEDFRAAHPDPYTAFDPAGPALDYTPLEQRTLAAALEQELQPKARPLNRMELALLDWWRDRRPIFSDSVAHALEPTINCHSPAEDKMANMAAELFMQACENGLLSYEPALAPFEDL